MRYNIGDIVQYSRPLEGEEAFLFIVQMHEAGRVQMQSICDETIKPISTVAEDEVRLAEIESEDRSLPSDFGDHAAPCPECSATSNHYRICSHYEE